MFLQPQRSDRSKKRSHVVFLWNLSRYPEKCRLTKCESTSEFEDGQELRYLDLENCKTDTGPLQNLDGCCTSDEPFVNNDQIVDCYAPLHDIVFDASFGGLVKLMVLTLHGSQPALAASDIASGLQSVPYFGGLDDINSGFTSVRKTSL